MIEAFGHTIPPWAERCIATLRLVAIIAILLLVLAILVPLQLLFLRLASQLAAKLPVTFHRILLWLLGVKVHVDGDVSLERPLLIVANHVSLLDISVLSTVAPLSFVAKSEIRDWPVIGLFARMQRTVFIERGDRRQAGQQATEIAERLAAEETMVLFPEGTTGDANALLPFKTPLFEAAKVALKAVSVDHAQVQPVALHYHTLHGMPLTRAERPHIAWPGEVGLLESLMPLILKGGLDVTVRCAPATRLDDTSDRKVVAAETRDAIRAMLTGGPGQASVLDSTP
jgi:1-acyl-sn-glycerol-3-phosphate acyltransferase